MRIAIAGAHGQVALHLGRLLVEGGHEVVGLIRSEDQQQDLRDAGVEPALVDLEQVSADELAAALSGCTGAVFAAGAGPGSGDARKDSVDRAGAALLADAAEQAGARRYVLLSSMGTDSVRGGAEPEGLEPAMLAYLRAKLASEEDLAARPLDWTVLRPGRLTDDEGTGRVRLAARVERGEVPRADVAAVLAAVLGDDRTIGHVFEVVGGDTPIGEALAAVTT